MYAHAAAVPGGDRVGSAGVICPTSRNGFAGIWPIASWVAVMLGQDVMPRNVDPLADAMPEADLLRAISEQRSGYEQTALKLPLASDYIERMIAG